MDPGVRVIWGRCGSLHVSLCVGGGEDVGGWELISWEPGLRAEPGRQPASGSLVSSRASPPKSYCGSPSALSPPTHTHTCIQLPTRDRQAVYLERPHPHPTPVRAGGELGRPWGRRKSFISHLRSHPTQALSGHRRAS